MPSIPVTCMICMMSIKDNLFPQHMQSAHGGMSTSEALSIQKNIPLQQTPIVLDKEAPPPDEFMQIAEMIDKPNTPPVVPSIPAEQRTQQQVEKKPLILRYQWTGNCPDCNTPVKTITLKANGQTVAVAFCLTHNEIDQREVEDLEKTLKLKDKILFSPIKQEEENSISNNGIINRKEGKRKYVKRTKSKLRNNITLPSEMSIARMSESKQEDIQS